MKTAREVFKENFWIGAKGGLIDAKHWLKMGNAVWLFLYLLREQTALNTSGEGIANYGHPKTVADISADMKGIPVRTIERWIETLRDEGYIRTETHGQKGLIFWIAKAKNKTKKVKVKADDALAMRSHTPPKTAEKKIPSPTNVAEKESSPPPQMTENLDDIFSQIFSGKRLSEQIKTPIPKGFISESLPYYNTASAAQTAASLNVLFEKEAKKLQTPRRKSSTELDERRRQLLFQAERIKRDYQPSGKVRVTA
jgi:hypothetical protein